MSVVTVPQVKLHLRITHSEDDDLLQHYIDAAEDELKQFLDRDELPRRDDACVDCGESDSTLNTASDSDDLAPLLRTVVFLLVQAMYEGVDGTEMEKVRQVALNMARPYRCRWGV